ANGTIVIGKNAKSGGGQGGIGENASQGVWRKHFPTESTASVYSTVAVGDNSSAAGVASVAVGSGVSAAREGYSTALGDGAVARGKSSTAVGGRLLQSPIVKPECLHICRIPEVITQKRW
ncbi:hypothetical protein P5H94_005423, partial [Escherichia coli]|nr:hypothetical protein [Escherichia coli]EKQ4280022.1 hypothetical protein [Escherichia coli]